MTLVHDSVGARVEFRHLDEADWHRSETVADGVTVFRSGTGDVAAVIVDLSLADGAISDEAAAAVEELLGPAAVAAARSLQEGEVEVQQTAYVTTRLVTTIELGHTPDDVHDLTMTASGQTELVVSAQMTDTSDRWAVVIDVERLRPVSAGHFTDGSDGAHARLRFGMDPVPGRYRIDVTNSPFDVPPDAGGTSGGARSRFRRIRPWLAVVGAAVTVGAVGLLAVGWPDRELPPSGPATTTPSVADPDQPLARTAIFERGDDRVERIELSMLSHPVVTTGDIVEFEFRRSQLGVANTAFDPNAETLEELIASCERRVGIVNPVTESGVEELVWYFRIVPTDPPGPTVEHDALLRLVLSGTQLASCGDDWADESARELEATRDLFYVPQTVRFSINRLMQPGRYEIHVVNPTGQPWPIAEPLEFLVEAADDAP